MSDKLVILTRDQLQKLLSSKESKVVIVSEPTTPTLMFQNVAINNSDIRLINEKYEKSRVNNFDNYAGTTFSRHQTFEYRRRFNRKTLEKGGPFANDIHDLIRKLALAIMGEKLNKNLSYEDWSEARDNYVKIKQLVLDLYQKRLDNLFGSSQ